jgi:predicted nuclease with TOPRIM domain
LELEDQYFHIHPFLISQNSLLLFLLELSAKKRAFDKYVDSLIGVKEVEESIRKRVEKEFEEKKVEKKKGFSSIKSFNAKINSFRERMKPIEKRIVRFFKKPGPYETTVRERINKTFGDYMGPQTAELSSLIKETCFKLSGQKV